MDFGNVFLNPDIIATYMPQMIRAVWVTIWISVLVVISGLALGAFLAGLRAYQKRWLAWPIVLFADLMRALPPLVLMLILFFGLPSLGVILSDWFVLYLVLTLVLAAFVEEIFWATLTSLPRGQWEAGAATGLSFNQVLVNVIFPQAVRTNIPQLVNRSLTISKMTAYGSVIGVKEIVSVAGSAQAFSGSATPLTMAAIAYLIIFFPAMLLSRYVENRFQYDH
ncbi:MULTISPECIES: amino acid ABC transporter permease [Roseobacteraceae]|uniref:Amino acid ABC transporter membrane protein 1, PAAT family n=1 Tax=Poseidonocella pacifica TaxID=871651 RepID=A0A1I0YU18_9RHOB|nr:MULTISPECIES: ABC transporter permease subunit [Roseobacteraceae]KAA8608390.1 polar amino acid ABC transporter permease [Salipiger aestuarii]SFB16875.1 amino acid ABC transporter membrane protein 1, PAAT family [Poseidonocella pacifica]